MQRKSLIIRSKEKQYRVGELLGEGQFGKVYKAKTGCFTDEVAIKIIRRSKFTRNQKVKNLLQRQMQVLSEFKHPSVIRLNQLIIEKQDVYLVYEYCQGGTLEDRITMTQQELIPLMEQMIDAMSHAEKIGIIHRDIKPANILLKEGKIKIADWGFSRLLGDGETTCSFIGSPAYMAPEVLKGDEYTIKADVWSLGVVLYETLTGRCPWRSSSVNSLYNQIQKRSLTFPSDITISSKTKKIISQMLRLSPSLRPSFREIKEMLVSQICLKSTRVEISSSKVKSNQNQEQQKIASCVFFLELIQWCRKQISNSATLLTFVKLVEKNLLKLKPLDSEQHILNVWEKQIRVVREIMAKLARKTALKSQKLREREVIKTESDGTNDSELNPEGEWQSLAKSTIKMVIEMLQSGYKLIKQQQDKKQALLIEINLLLDLIIFPEVATEYIKHSFQTYIAQLRSYSGKALLKLINHKLVLINKKYYR